MTLKWRDAVAVLAVCSSVALATLPRTANACSGIECAPDQFVPRAGTVPANLPGIAWWAGETWTDGDGGGPVVSTASDLSLECSRDDGSRHTVALDSGETSGYAHVQRKTPLVSGERCSLRSRTRDCDASSAGDGDGIWGAHDASYLSGKASFTVTNHGYDTEHESQRRHSIGFLVASLVIETGTAGRDAMRVVDSLVVE